MSEDLKLSYAVLSDPSLDVTKKYGVVDEENGTAWPAVFIIQKDGRVVWRSVSKTYKNRPTAGELLSRLDPKSSPAPR